MGLEGGRNTSKITTSKVTAAQQHQRSKEREVILHLICFII